jgi:hypothetical protein
MFAYDLVEVIEYTRGLRYSQRMHGWEFGDVLQTVRMMSFPDEPRIFHQFSL